MDRTMQVGLRWLRRKAFRTRRVLEDATGENYPEFPLKGVRFYLLEPIHHSDQPIKANPS